MTRKECFAALGLEEVADLDEIKRAYRRLAFSLHPDLNPDVPDAAKRFRRLNEAYVQLSKTESLGKASSFFRASTRQSTARAREEAKKAYSKARQGQDFSYSSSQQPQDDEGKEDVLKDILNDPFARRVFEDIYSHIREERNRDRQNAAGQDGNGQTVKANDAGNKRNGDFTGFDWTPASEDQRPGIKGPYAARPGVINKVKGWLRKQIDDEQVLRLPGESLIPGARVRLQIQHGLGGEPQVIELTLPPEFVPGKTMRLRGMGKRVGSWRGDLYVRIEPS